LHNTENPPSLIGQLASRMNDLSIEQQQWLLTMYANPVFAKKALEQ